MHRQSSRNTTNMDAIDCIVSTNDLALEDDVIKREYDHRSKSRRDQQSKRSNENSIHRPTARHSPPSVTHKRHSSPLSISSSSRSHHQQQQQHHNYYHPSQKHHRVSSPSLSPSTQPSSRHHRPTRPTNSTKRPHPKSESPYERRPPVHRSRTELSRERIINGSIPSIEESKITSKQETTDLSLISEDESIKTHDTQSNSTKTNESSSIPINNKHHSTPSISQLNSNDSLLEMSTIPQECELSIFAKSMLSTTTNTNSILTSSNTPINDFMQTIDLISKYKTMQAIPNTNSQIEVLSKEILKLIQKQIELQKIELDCREREIKLRELEITEREKRFHIKSNEPINNNEINIIEETIPLKSEILINQDIINISPDESSVSKSIVDTSNVKLSTKKTSEQRKTRFSQLIVNPSIFSSSQKPVVDLYSDDLTESNGTISSTDLKITSSNTCRKVEIQSSGNIDKTVTNKSSSDDLRLTISKNRTKQQNNDEHETIDNDNKQQSQDYEPSIEPIIDDKRDVRHHRQHQYSSSTTNNEKSHHIQGSNQKRYETDDLRSRLFDNKHTKPSRTMHKNNY